MEELRRGEVMIANWHRLAKKETNTVNGDAAKVVKTGEPIEITKNAGKENESVEIKYFESDAAWFKRIRQELGSGKLALPGKRANNGSLAFDVKLKLADGSVYPTTGKMNFVSEKINPATGGFDARAQVSNADGNLRPGQFVRPGVK